MRTNFRRIILMLSILIPAVIFLAWILQDIARALIVIPFSYFLWMGKQIIQSVPQFYYWIALIIFAFFLILKSISGRTTSSEANQETGTQSIRRSRLHFWSLQLSQGINTSSGRLANFLHRLALETLSFTYHYPAWQVDKQLLNGEMIAPDELKKIVQLSKQMPVYQTDLFKRLMDLSTIFWENLRKKKKLSFKSSSGELELEVIIRYLENQMEIHHDNAHL